MALATDSFCERCGTRYVFQASASKTLSIKSARLLAKGLRNFVMNDGQSFEDSMHAARHEDSSADSSRLTQAFHKAFNFCMSCRQYACERCWNVKAGACLSCAPLDSVIPNPEPDRLIARMPVTRLDGEPLQPPAAPLAQSHPAQASYAGPAAFGGPASSGGTTSFSAGRLTSEPGLERGVEAVVEPENAQPAWPEADRVLFEPEPAAGTEQSLFDFQADQTKPAARVPEWVLRRGSVDGESLAEQLHDRWSMWPITDPLAPEATLTPEELSLVEAQLLRPESDSEGQPVWTAEPEAAAVPEEPFVAATAEPEAALLASPAEPEAAAVAEAPLAAPTDAFEIPAIEPVPEPSAPAPAVPQPVVSAPARAASGVPEPTPVPAAGRFAPLTPRQSDPPLPLALMAQRGTASNGIWPHPTPWVERVNRTYSPIYESETVAEPASAVEAATTLEAKAVDTIEVVEAPVVVEPATEAVTMAETAAEEPVVDESMADQPAAPQLTAIAEPAAEAVPAPAPAVTPVAPDRAPEPAAVPTQPLVLREASADVAWQERLVAAQAAARAAVPTPAESIPGAPVAAELFPEAPVAAAPAIVQPIPVGAAVVPEPLAFPAVPAPAVPMGLYQPVPQSPDYQEPAAQSWPPLGAQWPAPISAGPVWPAPAGVTAPAAILTPKAAATTEMWAQSSQEVINRGTVRVCHHCSLPLSTHARFCRRCGTSQN